MFRYFFAVLYWGWLLVRTFRLVVGCCNIIS